MSPKLKILKSNIADSRYYVAKYIFCYHSTMFFSDLRVILYRDAKSIHNDG